MVSAGDSASGMGDKDPGSGQPGKDGGSGKLGDAQKNHFNDRLSVTVGQYGEPEANAYNGGMLKSKSDLSTRISVQYKPVHGFHNNGIIERSLKEIS